ncbi:MAG TPA: hypothetical protein VMI73_00100 [Trebonia sp.]|nr:hypothetical protein [Trebonia sp.]
MIVLDSADLAVIAARTLSISAGDALAVMDIPAARAALAEAQPTERQPDMPLSGRYAAAAAGVSVMQALLHHRPFPRQGRQVAVLAGLQFLSLNGWQADLDPPATTAVVIEALASGQLAAGDAAAWLAERLSQAPRARRAPRVRRTGRAAAEPATRRPGSRLRRPLRRPAVRAVAGALATAMVGGVAILATACSRAPDMSPTAPQHAATTSQVATPVHTAGLSVDRPGGGHLNVRLHGAPQSSLFPQSTPATPSGATAD